jgi:hypothetical protein
LRSLTRQFAHDFEEIFDLARRQRLQLNVAQADRIAGGLQRCDFVGIFSHRDEVVFTETRDRAQRFSAQGFVVLPYLRVLGTQVPDFPCSLTRHFHEIYIKWHGNLRLILLRAAPAPKRATNLPWERRKVDEPGVGLSNRRAVVTGLSIKKRRASIFRLYRLPNQPVEREVHDLIRRMSTPSPALGRTSNPRRVLTLGIEVSQTTFAK